MQQLSDIAAIEDVLAGEFGTSWYGCGWAHRVGGGSRCLSLCRPQLAPTGQRICGSPSVRVLTGRATSRPLTASAPVSSHPAPPPDSRFPALHALLPCRRLARSRRAPNGLHRPDARPSDAVPALCRIRWPVCRGSGLKGVMMTASSIPAARGGGYARYLEGKTVAPERGTTT